MKSANRLKVLMTMPVSFAMMWILANNGQAQSGANQPGTTTFPFAKPTRPYLKNTKNPDFKSTLLTKPIDLIDLPPYPSKSVKFVTGNLFSNAKGGASVTMQFSVAERPREVIEWYKNAFAQNRWQLMGNQNESTSVAAIKSNNICQITTMGPSKKGSTCDFILVFKFYKPTDFPHH